MSPAFVSLLVVSSGEAALPIFCSFFGTSLYFHIQNNPRSSFSEICQIWPSHFGRSPLYRPKVVSSGQQYRYRSSASTKAGDGAAHRFPPPPSTLVLLHKPHCEPAQGTDFTSHLCLVSFVLKSGGVVPASIARVLTCLGHHPEHVRFS